jgi:hypothetical protein
MHRPFTITRQCSLCRKVVVFQRMLDLGVLTDADEPDASVSPQPQRYCSTCGGELHEVSDDRDGLDGEARALARSGHEVAAYGPVGGECWALVGPADDRAATLFAAVGSTCAEAARGARRFLNCEPTVRPPDADVSALDALGLTAQWCVLDDEPTRVALRVWRGERLAPSSIATGTPEQCVTKTLKHLMRDE